MRCLGERVPCDKRIEIAAERVEVLAEPAGTLRVGRIGGRPDVGAQEMRSAGVLIAGALNQRHASLVENRFQPREPRVQAERHAGRIGADLEHVAGGHRQRRPAAVIERVGVGNQHAERIIAAGEVQHDERAQRQALRFGHAAQNRRRRKTVGEGGDTALEKRSS